MRTSLLRLSALIGVPVMAGAVTLTSAGSAFAAGNSERAIVVLSGAPVTAPGVHVVSHLDAMHLELVDASPYALSVLAGTPGVVGITRDTPVRFMGKDAGGSSNSSSDGSNASSTSSQADLDAAAAQAAADATAAQASADAATARSNAADQAAAAAHAAADSAAAAVSAASKKNRDALRAAAHVAAEAAKRADGLASEANRAETRAVAAALAAAKKAADATAAAAAHRLAGVYASEGLGGSAGKDSAGNGIDVAIIDTGVSDTAALNRASGRLVDGVDTSGLVDGSSPITETGVFADGYGHGTFMANVIAGSSVDGKHNLGVAPGSRVHVVKVANDQGESSLFAVLVGLNWVATHADTIKVANLALGVDRPMDAYGPDPLNVATEWVRAAGVTMVVAAGNTAGVVSDPGFTAGALTVGAADLTTRQASVAPFSGSAVVAGVQKPDVVASGVSVYGLLPPTSTIALANPGSLTASGLYRGSGTSEATGVVTGLAAIFLQKNPDADTTTVKSSLRAAARDLGTPSAGAGLVQMTRVASESAGDGENSFDSTAWLAGAYSGEGFTMDEWLSDLAGAWFGDETVGNEWMATRWTATRWTATRWTATRWTATRWSATRWSATRWSANEWAGASL
ncbi:MAG: serine protease AprX [Frankiaceae bacterium]|nr:serine protease AprX [Frankiaceae bacterium]